MKATTPRFVVWPMFLLRLLLLLPESSNGQTLITGFTLINAVTNQEIDLALNIDGDENIIDLASVGDRLSLRADVVANRTIGSVRLQVDGQQTADEKVPPYALGGDIEGNYKFVRALAVAGSYLITATAYSPRQGSGNIKDTASITLEVINSNPTTVIALAPAPAPALPAPAPVQAETDAQSTSSPAAAEAAPTIAANDIPAYPSSPTGSLSGDLMTWHKITIGFQGPDTSETNITRNPFTDYRLDVVFVRKNTQDDDDDDNDASTATTNNNTSSSRMAVPGYYAADGNAANSQATAGNVWLVHWAPDQVGLWEWTATFTTGANVALQQDGSNNTTIDATSAGYFDGATGSINVTATNKAADGRDHRGKGRLQYVGKHHLQFAGSGEYFLKAGADSPENFLAYKGFDNTPNNGGRLKSWSAHAQDFNTGDPTWASGKGTEIIGAINYLSEKGVNSFSFLTMNIKGDDANVFPYISDSSGSDRQRIDVSKTAQWEIVLEHGDHMGLYLHFKTQETENDQLLDGGALGNERKLYYRELVARFGHHLALNWNLGEENTNSDSERKEFATFFKQIDPYDHPIVIHTYPGDKQSVYGPLLGYADLDGISLQSNPAGVFRDTLQWCNRSARNGRKWVVANDEQGNAKTGVVPDADDPNHDTIRQLVLWGNIMAGGAGVEYYFGYSYQHSDLTCEDYRSRDKMWDQSRHALEFFQTNSVPFWGMRNANKLVEDDAWCLAQWNGGSFVVYLRNRSTTFIDLSGPEDALYSVKWYDPRNGGPLQDGSTSTVNASSDQSVGLPPDTRNAGLDWVVLLRRINNDDPIPSPPLATAPPSLETSESTLASASHPDIVKIIDVPGDNPRGVSWADSYSVGDECFCASTFDHNIGPVEVETPLGNLTVLEVCSLLGPGPGREGHPIYNDVNCGNGPANDAGDEGTCPGRVDIGRGGCGHIGPPWNFSRFVSSVPTMPSVATVVRAAPQVSAKGFSESTLAPIPISNPTVASSTIPSDQTSTAVISFRIVEGLTVAAAVAVFERYIL